MKDSSWSRIAFNLELWLAARYIPLFASKKSLRKVLLLTEALPNPRYFRFSPEYINQKVQRRARRPWLMRDRRCLRIGVLGYRFLRKAGYNPELHFGVVPDSIEKIRMESHCWVCLAGSPVIGEPLPEMLTIYIHNKGSDLSKVES